MAFSPDGKTLAVGYGAGGIVGGVGGFVLWDVAARKRLVAEPTRRERRATLWSVAFSPDGRPSRPVHRRLRGGVVLWDVAARKRLGGVSLAVEGGFVMSVAFSPDGKTIAAGYSVHWESGGVVLWDVAARKRLVDEPLAVKEGWVGSVAFSPDGKTLRVDTDGDGVVRRGVVLWDVAAAKRLVDEPLAVKEGYVGGCGLQPRRQDASRPDTASAATSRRRRRGAVGLCRANDWATSHS